MGESIGAVQLDVKLNNASLDSEIKEAGTKSGGTFSSIFSSSAHAGISGALSTLKAGVLGLGATIASGGGLFALADGAVNAGNSVYELAQKMHLPTDQAALLNRELSLSNTDSGSFISTMTKLDKGLESAGTKGNATTKALQAFGVTLTDGHGQLLPMNQQLANLAAAYQNAAANGNDEAFTAQVLGNRGVALTGILSDYNDVAAQAGKTKGIGIDPNEAHQAALGIQTLKSQVSILGTTIGSAVLPIILQAFPPIQSALANIATTIKTHQGQIQSFARIIGGVIVSITQGVAGILNFIAGHGSAAITAIGGIVAVMGAWKAITAVMSVVMGVQNTIAAVTQAREEGVTIAKLASVAATEYQEGAQIGLNAALLACPLTWIIIGIIALVAVFVILWTHCAGFRQFWENVWNGIKAAFAAVWNYIGPTIISGIQAVQQWWNKVWPEIAQVLQVVWDVIKVIISAALAIIVPVLAGELGILQGIWTAVWGIIKDTLVGVWNIIVDAVKMAWGVISNTIKLALDIITGIFNIFRDIFTGNWKQLGTDIGNTVRNIGSDLGGIFSSIFNGIGNIFGDIATTALKWGGDIINGIVTGIKSAISNVTSAVGDVANVIKSFLHFSTPDVGPLVNFHDWPKDMMSGMAKDILANKGTVMGALQSVTNGMSVQLQGGMTMAGIGAGGTKTITTNNTKAPVINVNGPVNVTDQGNQRQTLQQLQFLAAI